MKLKPRATRITIIIFVLILALVGYYAYLSNKSREKRAAANMTAIEETLSRDLSKNYPPTPKEVMKYYNDILKCFYNEDCSDEDIEALGIKARELYDAELNSANELGSYLMKLKNDVEQYQDDGMRMTSSSVAASANVDYYTRDGYSFARLLCTYKINEKGTNEMMTVVYLLRKDSDKKWKIYGWDFAQNVDLDGDGVLGD